MSDDGNRSGAVAVRRLGPGDGAAARRVFEAMARVFDEEPEPLPDAELARLLGSPDFWVVGAFSAGAEETVAGGLTAHALPMTRAPGRELFIYDVAVVEAQQRRGVGRALLERLRAEARAAGITTSFVAADDEDTHALRFYEALGGVASKVTHFTFDDA